MVSQGSTPKTGPQWPQEKMGIPGKAGMPTRATFIIRPPKRRKGPVERPLISLRGIAIGKVVSHAPQSLSVYCKKWRFQFSCETSPSIILLSKQNNLYGNIYEIVCHIGSLLKRLKDNILWNLLFFCKPFSMTEIKVFNGFCERNII